MPPSMQPVVLSPVVVSSPVVVVVPLVVGSVVVVVVPSPVEVDDAELSGLLGSTGSVVPSGTVVVGTVVVGSSPLELELPAVDPPVVTGSVRPAESSEHPLARTIPRQ